MSDLVVVACIQGAVAVIVLILGARLNGKVNQVREQVKNGHTTNMREEQDERHLENKETLAGNAHKLDQVLEELEVIRNHITRLWSRSRKHTEQLEELEEWTQEKPSSRFEPRPGRHTERRQQP